MRFILKLSTLFVFLFVILLANCGSSNINTSDSGDSGSTGTSDSDSQIGGADDDTTSPGTPTEKVSYLTAYTDDLVQGTADHYDFLENPDSYSITTTDLHGTELTVAIHTDVSEPTAWADTVKSCWHAAWHVFEGYRYDRYAILVRSASSSDTNFSLSEVGISVHGSDADDDYEFVCHEMFHSWNGKLLAYTPDGSENLFQKETWVAEGATVYYSFRNWAEADSEDQFTSGMEERLADYNDGVGGTYDLSLQGIADLIGEEADSVEEQSTHDAVGMLYARGALINYLLDQQLVDLGYSLDDVMSYLYVNFGLEDTSWTQADYEQAVEEMTGISFQSFFDNYVETNALVSIESFEFFSRYE